MSDHGSGSGVPSGTEYDQWWIESRYAKDTAPLPKLSLAKAKMALWEVLDHFTPGGADYNLPVQGWKSIRCPFHEDRKPSASVSLTRFKCHSCDMSGDAVDLVMKELHMEFREALAYIEELI